MQTILKYAPDDELTIEVVSAGDYTYEYPASALHILIEPNNHDLSTTIQYQCISSATCADVLVHHPVPIWSKHCLISSKMQISSTMPLTHAHYRNCLNRRHLNQQLSLLRGVPVMLILIRSPIISSKMALYEQLPRFDTSPIKIAIINTLDEPIGDFVEALRRAHWNAIIIFRLICSVNAKFG